MDVLLLSRLQFAVSTYFHFLFVPLTLGLSMLIAIMETIYLWRDDEEYLEMARFWGKLFLINFSIGVVTGISLEFQFGTNWSRYSEFVGDIFGSLLAIEATLAFFLESTFIAVWAFGWSKVSRRLHLASIWIVALASTVSAYWILAANAWMQHPVGFVLRNGRAELDDFMAVLTQKFAVFEFLHTVSSAYVLAGFFVLGVSAYHIRRSNRVSLFKKSFALAALFSLVSALAAAHTGHTSGGHVAEMQPAKLAAMESHWETMTEAPMNLLLYPDVKNERNLFEYLKVPGALSILAHGSPGAEVKGLKDFPAEDRPPVMITFLSFRAMVGLGTLLVLLSIWVFICRKGIEKQTLLLRILPWVIPLPYLTIQFGWTLTEVGRQPWIVYGLMRTSDAVSTAISAGQVLTSLIGFILIYSLLGLADFFLIFKYARKGPLGK
ncbi:MAG: cytochrome ubiquinol oxidase subunit I [Planctomycetes bacterium]|nr:cytochrome ubiquinol oxidase subunit I [Planctomycetota bacterium]